MRVRALLPDIRLPKDFRIALNALVPGAHHMAVAPAGGKVFVGTRTDRVWAALDRNGDIRVDEVRAFGPGQGFRMPNGSCLDPDGTLFVPKLNRLRAFAATRRGPAGLWTMGPV